MILLLAVQSGAVAKPKPPASPVSAADLAAQAERARAAKAPDAPALYARALKANPSWKEGWWSFGSIQYERQQYADCAGSFERLTKLDGANASGWTMLGLCEKNANNPRAAIEHLRRGQQLGISVEAIDTAAKYALAELFTVTSSFEEALGVLAAASVSGKQGSAWTMLAGCAALWKPMLPNQVPAEDRELVFLAGRAFWDGAARRSAEAREGFDSLLAKYPTSPGVHYLYGSFELINEADRAVAEFEQELKISPDHPGALAALAAEYLRRGDPAKGMPYARRFVELHPDAFAGHALLGRTLVESGDMQAGVRELEQARQLGPNEPQTRIALASVYAKLGRAEDAARERREFLRLKGPAQKPVQP